MLTHMRRCDRMPPAAGVVIGVTLPHTARPQHPDAPSARRVMKRQTTGARSKGAGWEEVVRALMEQPNAPTAEDLTGRGLTPVLPRGRPVRKLGDGGHHPHCGERGRALRCPRSPRSRPRPPKRWQGAMWRPRWRRREDRVRLPWSWGSRVAGPCFFSLLFGTCVMLLFLFLL